VSGLAVLLQHLKTAADKATPGPWIRGAKTSSGQFLVKRHDRIDFITNRDAAFIALADPDVVKALAEVAEAAGLLRKACEWAICEDLNGVICSQPALEDKPHKWCQSCQHGWKLMRRATEEYDQALSRLEDTLRRREQVL
jgi:hypothetical protein